MKGIQVRIRLTLIAVLSLAEFCSGQTISLTANSGPPTSKPLVSGSSFSPNAAIDIYFDLTDEALVLANGTGAFQFIAITVPASAVPGVHWISAVQRSTQTGVQIAFHVNTNWLQTGFTANGKRFNPYENVLNISTVSGIDLLWRFSTGGGLSSPAIANDIVYVGSGDGKLYAISAASGAQLWSFATSGGVSNPAVANGAVYIGSGDSNVYAVNARTGAKLWSFTTGGTPTAPTVANGTVYIGDTDSNLYALNATTGTELWSFPADSSIVSTPAVFDGSVYFGTVGTNSNVYQVNATNGGGGWSTMLSNSRGGGGVKSSPAVANGVVFIGDESSNLFALNSRTGDVLWNYTTSGRVESAPAVANGVVYVSSLIATTFQNLAALSASTGSVLWTQSLTNQSSACSPAVGDGVVYVGSYYTGFNTIYALDAIFGTELWSAQTGDALFSGPSLANGMVYVGSIDGNLYAYGQPNAARAQSLKRPAFSSLRPDLSLRPSAPVVTAA